VTSGWPSTCGKDSLQLGAARPGVPCIRVRKGPQTPFLDAAFAAAELSDLSRFAGATGASVEPLGQEGGGHAVSLVDSTGISATVAHGVEEVAGTSLQEPLTWNASGRTPRVNATSGHLANPPGGALGHVVLASRVFGRPLDWYLEHLGLIVSDFLFIDGQPRPRPDNGLHPL
jgi:hypothetical protein